MKYIGIDFETANRDADSAISMGCVVIENGKVVDERYTLIQPPTSDFEFTYVHGLKYEDVKFARNFGELFPEFEDIFNNSILFAHNAEFDMNVLRTLFRKYNLKTENLLYFCTLELSRQMFPMMEKHNLKYVAEKLCFKFNHHHALEDARAAAHIYFAALKKYGERAKTMLNVMRF